MKLKITILTLLLFGTILLPVSALAKVEVELDKCIDGDTVKVIYKTESVSTRFLAINTPEIGSKEEYYGEEAADYTCKKLTNAKHIYIEFDKNSDKYDKYDRLLAWVYADSELLQLELIEGGYAEVKYLYGDYDYTPKLQAAEKIAQDKNVGIWDSGEEEDYTIETSIGIILVMLSDIINKKSKKKKINLTSIGSYSVASIIVIILNFF